jgi:hypothetical protein
MNLIKAGAFDAVAHQRTFHGRGSLVRVIEGVFAQRRVRLDEDITQNMLGSQRIRVEIGGRKGTIELFKLAL